MPATILMTDPSHYDVSYAINPWMQPGAWQADSAAHSLSARASWESLKRALFEAGAAVEVMPGAAGWPDMVFPANAAVVLDGKVLPARFKYKERQGEEPFFRAAFQRLVDRGILREIGQFPADVVHEGAGDGIWDLARQLFWTGYGPRSDRAASDAIADYFGQETVTLELITPNFYHLDTCFCPLSGGEVLYFQPAFGPESIGKIRDRVADDLLIEATPDEAAAFCVNAVCIGSTVVMATVPPRLASVLAERGYNVVDVGLAPYIMSGGGAFCMTLRLDWISARALAERRLAALETVS